MSQASSTLNAWYSSLSTISQEVLARISHLPLRRRTIAALITLSIAGILIFQTSHTIVDGALAFKEDPSDWSISLTVSSALRRAQKEQLYAVYHHHELWDRGGDYGKAMKASLKRIARCLEGKETCPKRPIILTDYLYISFLHLDLPPGGEMIWMDSVLEDVRTAGFEVISIRDYEPMILMSKLMPDLIHMVWTDETGAVSCTTDPRCIRDYSPPYIDDPSEEITYPANATDLTVKLEDGQYEEVPLEERGTIPLSQLMVVTWWANSPDAKYRADDYEGPEREAESHNPLGNDWAWVPFSYPGHTYIPWSIERVCREIPWVPHDEREKHSALVFSKWTSVYHRFMDANFWSSQEVKDRGFKFYGTAVRDHDTDVPAGIENLGIIPRRDFAQLLSKVRVLIGIGAPTISPSPYVALCQGVPVIMQSYVQEPFQNTWDIYIGPTQHGPVLQLKPPYVYQYWKDNTTELLNAIQSAMDNPIDSYVPPNMQKTYTQPTIRDALLKDWDAAAAQKIREVGRDRATRPPVRKGGKFDDPRWHYKLQAEAIDTIRGELPRLPVL